MVLMQELDATDLETFVQLRHELHHYPELAFDERRTAAVIARTCAVGTISCA